MHLTSVDLPAPFSPSSAWTVPGSTLIDTSSSATSEPKILVMPIVSSEGARIDGAATVARGRDRSDAHGRFSTKLLELDTEPNTPPCILTILIAARWLP